MLEQFYFFWSLSTASVWCAVIAAQVNGCLIMVDAHLVKITMNVKLWAFMPGCHHQTCHCSTISQLKLKVPFVVSVVRKKASMSTPMCTFIWELVHNARSQKGKIESWSCLFFGSENEMLILHWDSISWKVKQKGKDMSNDDEIFCARKIEFIIWAKLTILHEQNQLSYRNNNPT